MTRYAKLAAGILGLCGLMYLAPTTAQGFVTVADGDWDETLVRSVLHTFSYGGSATDEQISTWADMDPSVAITQMLTFDAVNTRLSPVQDVTAQFAESLETLQVLWASNDADNRTCPSKRSNFNETTVRADGDVVLRNLGLQNTWIAAVRARGLNPFRHYVGFWLANYHMAVNLHDTEPPLIREMYDTALDALASGSPFHEVLAGGASAAAVAREYGHRSNIYNNNTEAFRGNDDFAREFHQLFFRINGDLEDLDYHENITIENTALALTGMQIDKEPGAYGTTLTRDWWVAPIDFTDHRDATNRNLRNFSRHYRGELEILREPILGATAEDKLFSLAAVAINHPESLDNLPVSVISFFADDNLDDEKVAAIRAAWAAVAGTSGDLLSFLQAYAVSTTFHHASTYKYRTAFQRNLSLYNLNTVDNDEAYGNSFSPRANMQRQGAEVFIPVHDVFGGQTSLNAANNPNLFKEAYNTSVDFPNRVAKTTQVCRDDTGTRLRTWRKDWARVIPDSSGVYPAAAVGQWLWQRFIGDGGANYGPLERAHVTALLATGLDLGYVIDTNNPDIAYSAEALEAEPLRSVVAANEVALLDLDNAVTATRREANRRVGLAINFIAMTPFMFASNGMLGPISTPVTVPNVTGLTQSAAQAAIVAADLTVGAVTTQNDASAAGTVLSQNPVGSTQVAPGSAVDLVVSTGPAQVTVPDVVDQAQSAAEAAIAAAGFAVGTVTAQSSDTVPADAVISQNPSGGTQVAAGSAVDLVVSSGLASVTVPDVAGQTQAAAEAAITGAGLTVGTVTAQSSDTVPVSAVISQSLAAGSSVAPGGVVDLVVSTGPPIQDQPPMVAISSPGDGAAFNAGDSIGFAGTAGDIEDGDLSAGIFWTSDLDGTIGTGGFSTTLSAGTHTITASVADSSGQSASDTIVVTVSAAAPVTTVNFDDPAPAGASDALVQGVFEGIDFGADAWRWSAPYRINPSNHLYFASFAGTSRTFGFAGSQRRLVSVTVYALRDGTLTLSDDAGQLVSREFAAGQTQRIETGWSQSSQTVTVSFSGGWAMGLDDISYQEIASP